jgi:hypothetical protein
MRAYTIIIAIVTLVLISFMLICGLWINSNGADAEAIAFHRTLGITGIISSALTSVAALAAVHRKKSVVAAK